MSRRGQSTYNIFGGGDAQPQNVSSNAYASSSSTNSCNTITDRSSTRVHAPPGGRQQFNIFGGSNHEQPKRTGRKMHTPAPQAAAQKATPAPAPVANKAIAAGVSSRGVSSNSFASASTTNSCNTITDRSSTRVHAPPGGKQQFNIFGGSNYAEPPKRTGRKRIDTAPQAAQKQQQLQQPSAPVTKAVAGASSRGVSSNAYASSATTNSCNTITDRPSSRVLAAPGGKQSFNIFGGSEENTSTRANNKVTKGGRASVAGPKGVAGASSRGVSSNAYASSSTTNSCNTITDRPSTRVHAPPGGRSSFSLG